MSYKPLITGGVVVEVSKEEYENLVRASERLETVTRMFKTCKYVSNDDIKAVLDIEQTEGETDAVQN